MSQIILGRVGFSGDVTVEDPDDASRTIRGSDRVVTISGTIATSTLAEGVAIREELMALPEMSPVPITWDVDSSIDGFYQIDDVSAQDLIITDRPYIRFNLNAIRLGTDADLAFRSVISSVLRTNDHGVDAAEAEPFHAPSAGHSAYSAVVASSVTRENEDASIVVYRDISETRPIWSVPASGFLDGAARVVVNSYTRSGRTTLNDPLDWILTNGNCRVQPVASSSRLSVEAYDPTSWEAKEWALLKDAAELPQWEWMSILRNDPEECIIRLEASVTGGGKNTLDLSLRRGSRFVVGYLSLPSSGTILVKRSSNEAGTAITPTGATSAVAVRATSDDGAGNRYVVGAALSHSDDLTAGGVSKSAAALGFFIGAEKDGSLAASGDQAADLCLQYLGLVAETVKALRR